MDAQTHPLVRASAAAIAAALIVGAAPPPSDPKLSAFRATYQEMVETDSSAATGSCTAVAEEARARLVAVGYPEATTQIILAPNLPRDGNLVAELPGSDPSLEAMLLMAHIDVVNANLGDWKRDPFKLVEENGYFYARGAIDDKAMAAIFVDSFIRFKQQHYVPRRTIKLALTCGEESGGRLKGMRYLIEKRPETVRAAFAINEGAQGSLDASGKRLTLNVEAGQKAYQDFTLIATGDGAHSSRPGKDNVLTRMATALVRLGAYRFQPRMSDVTRRYFTRSAAFQSGAIANDMKAVGAGSNDPATIDRLADADPVWNAMIRTTCVATMENAGHARNALAQRAEVNVNCRILPGQPIEEVQATLAETIADPSIEISLGSPAPPPSKAPPLTPEILEPIEQVAARMWPGVPVIPAIAPGATDGRFLTAAGIPTYGVSGLFVDPDGNGVHGLDERVRTRSLYEARDFLFALIQRYAGPPVGRRSSHR